LKKLDDLRNSNNGGEPDSSAWIYGTSAPTALDSTLMCLLSRLIDVKLEEIVPAGLLEWAKKTRETERFKENWQSLT
jgi:hypothetical protein